MFKRLFAALTGLILIFTAAGCSQTENAVSGGGLKVVCSIAPLYDWTRRVTEGADGISLSLIIGDGTDMHSFQPSAADMIAIKSADVMIFVGGESDGWIRNALKEAANEEQKVICLMDILKEDIAEEETVEGMQGEEDDGGSNKVSNDGNMKIEEDPEYDEHVWMSLRLARKSCKAIEGALTQASTKDAQRFKANLDSYYAKLISLDKQYEEAINSARLDTLVVCDRYPFRYLSDDYGLKYSAAFAGCSAETEASFETVKYLADKIKALDSKAVLTIENSDGKLAKTVIDTAGMTDVKIEALDSMQSAGKDLDYLGVMTGNLDILKSALA